MALCIKEIVIVTRSFNDRIYIVSMDMNTKFKVDSHFSNAQPFIHFSSSKKLYGRKLSGKTPEGYDL